jgi:hypothetical protein
MRKSVLVVAVVAATIFGIGYLVGQLRAAPSGSAAGVSRSQSPQRVNSDWRGFRAGGLDSGGGVHVFMSGPHAAGTVTAINGSSITIKPDANLPSSQQPVTTIVVTSSTHYSAGPETGGTSPSLSSIKVGTFLLATGTLSSDGKTLTAMRVFILPSAPSSGVHVEAGGPHVAGAVTAIKGDTVAIKPDVATWGDDTTPSVATVNLTGSTQYFAGPMATGSKSSVVVGSHIIVQGTLSSDGKSITASRVIILPAGAAVGVGGVHVFAGGPHAAGTVTAVNGSSITIKPDTNRPDEPQSVTTIVVTSSTQYFAGPKSQGASATRSSIKVGSYVLATGTLSSDGKTLTAKRVFVLPSAPTGPFMRSGHFGFGGPFGQWRAPFGQGTGPFAQFDRQPGTQHSINA